MSKPRYFNTHETATLLKVTQVTVRNWIDSGFVDPIRRGLRGRDSHLLDESALFALAMGRACRQRGMDLRSSGAVTEYAARVGLEKLREEFAAGRRFLVVVGDATADVLLTRTDAFGPLDPRVRDLIGPFVPVVNVDLFEGFHAFEEAVAALIAEQDATAAARA
jgi:hypothetical protein